MLNKKNIKVFCGEKVYKINIKKACEPREQLTCWRLFSRLTTQLRV